VAYAAYRIMNETSNMPITVSERVYHRLRQMVFSGELAPGERLVQRKLADKLGVSSIPVIEATRRLERDGLVISHPNWGAQVQVWTEEDIEGAYLAREALEGISCRLFVQRATDVQRAELIECGRQFEKLVMSKDAEGYLESDLALHNHIVRATRASTLIHITESSFLITMTLRYSQRKSRNPGQIFPDPSVHGELIEALLGSDPEVAEAAGRKHVRRGFEQLRQLLAQTHPQQ
jgi:DNA-binding GntR family transcriptional regulator